MKANQRDPSEVLARLPKSKKYLMLKPAARAFYHMLLRGDDVIDVLDNALEYYEKTNNILFDSYEQYVKQFGPLKEVSPSEPLPPEQR